MSLEVGSRAFDPARCNSLIELLQSRASLHPDKVAFTFLPDGEDNGITITYAQLDQRAKSSAVGFRAVADDRP